MDNNSNARMTWLSYFISLIVFFTIALSSLDATSFLFENGPVPILLLFFATGWAAYRFSRISKTNRNELRHRIDTLYASLSIKAQDERFMFNGDKSQIIEDKEGHHDRHRLFLSIQRFARNNHGEYCWMVLEADPVGAHLVYIKHVEHKYARALLRERYIQPALPETKDLQPMEFSEGRFIPRRPHPDEHRG